MALLIYKAEGETVQHTHSAAVSAGTPLRLKDGRTGVSCIDIAANTEGSYRVKGILEGPANSSDTWNKGDKLVWDVANSKIVKAALTFDTGEAVVLGPATQAKTSGQLVGRVHLNQGPQNQGIQIQQVVYEFDCETGVDTATHLLIPAEQNPHGLLLLGAYGIITEAMVGSSQDQGIITVEDSDGTDICTLTPSDGAADAIGDVIVGTADVFTASTGDAAKLVAAGKGVQAFVSQVTAGGSPAGKVKVYLLFMPLL